MVTYNLLKIENGVYIYEYFPEGRRTKKSGSIELDVNLKTIKIKTIAEEDSLYIITKEELNNSRNSINELRKEEGLPPLTEKELPTANKNIKLYYYGSHVVHAIWKDFKQGTLKEKGMVAWY